MSSKLPLWRQMRLSQDVWLNKITDVKGVANINALCKWRCYHHAPCLNNLAIKEITLWAVHSNMSCRATPLKSWLMNGCSQSGLSKGRCSSKLLVWYDRIFFLFDFSWFVLFLYKLFFQRVKFYLLDLMMRLIGVFIWKYSAVWALWASDRLVACQRPLTW